MLKRLLILIMLIPLLLAACSGAESGASIAEPPMALSESQQGETDEPDPTETTIAVTTLTPEDEIAYEGPQMECTLVSDKEEAPAELVSILGVKDTDWVLDAETAAVTIVEYSDFQ